jgi:hypothetical protein
MLNLSFEQLDPLGWLRPTTIEIGKVWKKKQEQKLLANAKGNAPPVTMEIKQQVMGWRAFFSSLLSFPFFFLFFAKCLIS